jgi:ribonuclease BN (tRNA processing enzyme)
MNVTVLGSGTGFPSLIRGSPAILIRTGETNLLMDSGPGSLRQLLKAGTSFMNLNYVLYSHFHPDHTLDFLTLLFALKNPDLPSRTDPITIFAGQGFQKLYAGLRSGYSNWIVPPEGTVSILELPIEEGIRHLSDSLTLRFYRMNHTPSSLGYRLDLDNRTSVAYSGDTDMCDELVELGRNADLFILECSFPEGQKRPGHLTPSLAGTIAQKACARTLVLNHLYPQCENSDLILPCKKNFDGKVIVAEDMMSFDL